MFLPIYIRKCRRWCALLAALLLLLLPCAAHTADVPAVIDRITHPKASARFSFPKGADLTRVYFPKIRDADCALIVSDGKTLMIDCGVRQQAGNILALLRALGIRRLDSVLITHPHRDHIEGLFVLLDERISIGQVILCHPQDTNDWMIKAVKLCRSKKIPLVTLTDGQDLTVGHAVLHCFMLKDTEKQKFSLNDRSAQLMMRVGDRSLYFTADLTVIGERQLLKDYPASFFQADILKCPHHGVGHTEYAFWKAVSPALVIVTNTPYRDGIVELMRYGAVCVRTGVGAVRLTTDGRTWLAESFPEGNPQEAK